MLCASYSVDAFNNFGNPASEGSLTEMTAFLFDSDDLASLPFLCEPIVVTTQSHQLNFFMVVMLISFCIQFMNISPLNKTIPM